MMGRATAGAACCAPTGYCCGKARPGVESGSNLPHYAETWPPLIWSAAACRRFRGRIRGNDESDVSGAEPTRCDNRVGSRLLRLGSAAAGTACCAPTESWHGKTRPRKLVAHASCRSVEQIKRAGGTPALRKAGRRVRRELATAKRGRVCHPGALSFSTGTASTSLLPRRSLATIDT